MGQWVKGVSGNPEGRKPELPEDLKQAFREDTEEARQTLLYWMKDRRNPSASVRAAIETLNRGWGMPVQMSEPAFKRFSEMTEEEKKIWADDFYRHNGKPTIQQSRERSVDLHESAATGQGKAGQ